MIERDNLMTEFTHDLKISNRYYDDVVSGLKTFEIRKNDRNFKVGDLIRLHEVNVFGEYTSRLSDFYKIIYITDYEQKDGYVVLGIKEVEK